MYNDYLKILLNSSYKETAMKLIKQGFINVGESLCVAGISKLRISPNGNINPCELFRDIVFGNILEENFDGILSSEKRKQWIKTVRNTILYGECIDCHKSKLCPKCIGIAYLETGKIGQYKTDFLCQLADAKYESEKVRV